MDTPGPEVRGPLISALTQLYTGADKPTRGVDITLGDITASLVDLVRMFLFYVQETGGEGHEGVALAAVGKFTEMFATFARQTEELYPGSDFLDFLQRQAAAAILPDDPDA